MTDDRVPEAASVAFSRVASEYERWRPSYPRDLLDRVAAAVDLGAGRSIVDLGAGTGKLTRLLLPYGGDVVAIEPLAEMRAQLVEVLPEVQALDGTAEAIPLPDASVDVVTVAQAFHWFDTRAALDELARVLRPGGWLVLIWNERGGHGWMVEFNELADELSGGKAHYRGETWSGVLASDDRYGPLQSESEIVTERTTPARALDSIATRSWIASKEDGHRAAIMARLADFLATHPDVAGREEVEHQHPCAAHWCQRR